MTGYAVPRGTRANLNAKATAATIVVGQVYLITDENRLAVGLTTSTYQDFAKYSEAEFASLPFVIDGGGAAITTGLKGYLEVPANCTIQASTLLADQSGSIVVDVWKCSYANFNPGTHPVSADKITASAPPTISSSYKAQDSTLTGWTTSLSKDDILSFNVNSVTTIQRVTISLRVLKT